MKKRKLMFLLLTAAVLAAGCGKKEESMEEQGTASLEEAGERFPDTYEKESKSGKVRFSCKLVTPEQEGWENPHSVSVEGLQHCDREKAWDMFGQGKEISEEYNYPAEEGRIPAEYYIFSDKSQLYLREGVTFGSGVGGYGYLGLFQAENVPLFEKGTVSFKSQEACVEEVKDTMRALGYDTEEFDFQAYPLPYETMREMEEKEAALGNLPEDKRKESWGAEDEAYAVYAYQTNQGMPVFHELMGIARIMADDSPDNGQVMALYSPRGFESLNISDCIYELKKEEETVPLLPFDQIAAVVEEKYESILDDSVYDVTRAKLFLRVYLNEQQEYAAEPVWHFQVTENESSEIVVLVNAQTGKEVYLM